jgi:Spy/CpxP family protein refolding chaperone
MMNHTRMQVFGVAMVSALLLASTAAAQRDGRRGFHGEGPHWPGRSMRMLRELDLSDEQRQQVRALFEEVERTGVPERLREARESLHEAIESGADESTLRQQASALGEVEGDAAVEIARVRSRIQEILTPEQKQELEQLKAQARERMELHRRHREERKRSKSGADLL